MTSNTFSDSSTKQPQPLGDFLAASLTSKTSATVPAASSSAAIPFEDLMEIDTARVIEILDLYGTDNVMDMLYRKHPKTYRGLKDYFLDRYVDYEE